MNLVFTNGEDPHFLMLCTQLDEELDQLAGGASKREPYLPLNSLEQMHDVVLAYEQGKAVGCCAFRVYGGETAELKRLFVKPEYRGRGLSKLLVEALEQRARRKGFQKMILETGEPLRAAIGLYCSMGFSKMENYGPYRNLPDSICMKKIL